MKRKTWGGILIALPFVVLVTTFVLFAVSNVVISGMIAADGPTGPPQPEIVVTEDGIETSGFDDNVIEAPNDDLRVVLGNVINFVLGLAGMLAVLGIFVSVPVGIYLLSTEGKKAKKLGQPTEQ